jgi:Tfp pilus assembly protein PilP
MIVSNQVLRSQLKTLIPEKKGEIATYHMSHMFLRNLILGREDILKVKYGMPIGIYLGRLINVSDTKRVMAQILTLDGQMVWF